MTVERPCTWVRLGDDSLAEVLEFAEGHARAEGGTVVITCPFTGAETVMPAGGALVRWDDDGTFTVMSGRALGRQVREVAEVSPGRGECQPARLP